jgi:hypothetical protein
MEKATEPDNPRAEGRGKRGSTKSKLTIHEERIIKADAPPARALDLMIRPPVGCAVRVDDTLEHRGPRCLRCE